MTPCVSEISVWWLVLLVTVYAVPLGVYLHERRWLTRLIAPVLQALLRYPPYLLAAIALLVGQMVVKGSTKTNRVNSVEIELDGGTGSVINENISGGSGEPPTDSGAEGLSGVVPVRSFDPTQLCFTGITVSTNGVDLQVHCPTNIALPEGALDVYGASALEFRNWSLLASLAVADTSCLIPIAWEDIPSYSITNVPSRFFFAVGTRVDSDNDGLPDAYEHFVTDTRADNPDTDFDGLSDYEEWNLGLSPLNSDDAVQDPDGDGIPTLYEIRNGNNPNPFISDYQTAVRIVAGGAGVSSLKAAFDASFPYSIIEIAPGVHQDAGWTGLWFPPHSVMVTGPAAESGRAILRHNGGGLAAFYLDKTTNTHTFVQNLTLDMAQSPSRWLAGFWCGGNLPFAGESVSATFNNVVVRLAASDGANIGWFLRHANSAKVNLAGCVVNARGATCARGIYAIDAPPLRIENCSFINFPPDGEKASYGIQLESTPDNWGNAASNSPVEIANCLFDDSFTNALPLAFLERGVTYDVDLHRSLMPVAQTNRAVGAAMLYTNALTGVSGLLAPDSPAISAGAPPAVSTVDANGAVRGASPDIGAYQYVEFADSGFDSDGDGLTDYDELYVAGTDPTLYDTDGDGLGDGYEHDHGSNPLDSVSRFAAFSIAVSYKTGTLPNTTNYLAYGFSPTGWETNGLFHATAAASVSFTYLLAEGGLYAKLFCDVNLNGDYDADTDMLLVKPIAIVEGSSSVTFEVGDMDGDGQGDLFEHQHGSDPMDPKSMYVQVKVSVVNKDPYGTGVTNYISYAFSAEGWEPNDAEAFPKGLSNDNAYRRNFVTTNGFAYVKVFRDLDRDGAFDPDVDALLVAKVSISEKLDEKTLNIGDADGDGVPDCQEMTLGTDPLDRRSFCCDVSAKIWNCFAGTNLLSIALATNLTGVIEPVTPVTLATNPLMLVEYHHLSFTNAPGLYIVYFDDMNTNGIRDLDEVVSYDHASLTNHNTILELTMNRGKFDGDSDGILDRCEVEFGLDPDNRDDVLDDSDGDGMINLHEYWMGCDKDVPDGTNTLLSMMARSIDDRLVGKNPGEALPIYANYETVTSPYDLIPNTNCWAYGVDFSCCSMWNSITWNGTPHRWYAATAISPRHVIMANHFITPVNSTYYFRGTDGNIYHRVLTQKRTISTGNLNTDIQIGLLDSDLPPEVVPAKLLPSDFERHINTGRGLPVITLNQHESAYVMELAAMPTCRLGNRVSTVSCLESHFLVRESFYRPVVTGDSSSPRFLLVGNQLVLLHVMWSGGRGSGTLLSHYATEIQRAMNQLSPGYALDLFDCSAFPEIQADWRNK